MVEITLSGVQSVSHRLMCGPEGDSEMHSPPFTAVKSVNVDPVIQKIRGDWYDMTLTEISKMAVWEERAQSPDRQRHVPGCLVWLCSDPPHPAVSWEDQSVGK